MFLRKNKIQKMEEIEENNIKKVKTASSKMQDIFGIEEFEEIELKDKNKPEELKLNEPAKSSEVSKSKFNLYQSIYQPVDDFLIIDKKGEEKKPKVMLQRKNNLLTNKKISDELSYIEHVNIFIDDNNNRESEIIIQNFECKFLFDEQVHVEFINLVHFTPKYFEFPIYYVDEGYYDSSSKTTTITLKDYRSFKIKSSNNQIFEKLLKSTINNNDFYKYAIFYKNEKTKKNIKYEIDGWKIYDPVCEYLRQGVEFSDTKFCFSNLNNNYEICETYPYILVIPKKFDNKKELTSIAESRKKNRFPLLSYYYKNKKTYLFRSAQINKGGFFSKIKNKEIDYMNQITNMDNNSNNKGFLVFDCRPEMAARANSLKGGGVESKTDYNNCLGVFFGDIQNIHEVRKALQTGLLKCYYGDEKNVGEGKISFDIKNSNMQCFLSKFEKAKWLDYLSDLLLGSIFVAQYLIRGVNVLVHCTDGWDRTSQVCSLVQMILDPYYRTIEGFAVLIEKDWISFGHQFGIRNGCDLKKENKDQKSPIFIQFLHAVYQMTMQYPTAFEFNHNFLLLLSEQIYSNKYGTFLFNCEKEKFMNKAPSTMISIWSDIFLEKNKYLNDLYKPINSSLNIKGELKYMSIWNDFFFKYDKVGMAWDDDIILDKEGCVSKITEEKTKSILELLQIIKNLGQEELMKENKLYKLYKNDLAKND